MSINKIKIICSKSNFVDTSAPPDEFDSNVIATNAITGKLNEVSKIAEALDIALRGTQSCFDMDRCRSDSLDRKTEGNTSIDSRGSIDVSELHFFSIEFN